MVKFRGEGPEGVIVGRVLSIHGLSGQVRAQVLSDVPHRFDIGQILNIGSDPFCILSSQRAGNSQVILQFQGIGTRSAAEPLVGYSITVPETAAPQLPEGEYFHFQLLGLRVLTEEGEELGRITEILETGSNDVYVVSGAGSEILVPALIEVVREIRLGEGLMVVSLPDGLR